MNDLDNLIIIKDTLIILLKLSNFYSIFSFFITILINDM